MVEAVFVMLNNYFHDLAVAFLFASTLMAHVVLRYWPGRPSQDVAQVLTRVAWGSLVWVLLGGIVRVIFYKEYEWLPKAGTAQVPALMAKHVVLVVLTVWGLIGVVRLNRRVASSGDRSS
jgi:peptidoglycan/LPS O-acetylase OafA/YrhL